MRPSSRDLYAPYVLRNEMRWYVADLPFSCMHEEDRYLIFADLLFDMLGEPPARCDRRLALVRFEDVHPALPQWQLDSVLRVAREAGVPLTPRAAGTGRTGGAVPVAGGIVLYNGPAIPEDCRRADLRIVAAPFTGMADAIGASKVANIAMLGALLEITAMLDEERVTAALRRLVRNPKFYEMDLAALERGREAVRCDENYLWGV